MPCVKCPNGKYRFGSGQCKHTKEKCLKIQAAYHANKMEELNKGGRTIYEL